MNAAGRLALSCPAKVNLALSVGSPAEGGLHPIASWMVALNYGDHLVLQRRDGDDANGASQFDIAFDGANTPAVAGASVDWPLASDLTYRAHQLIEATCGRRLAVTLTLRKRIPAGAGLGGGSSDAAAMLVGLDRLFALKLGPAPLRKLAAQLGSDVAFFIGAAGGETSALVSGVGERIEPMAMRQVLHVVLIMPKIACPTGQVYRAFDELHSRQSPADVSAAANAPDDGRVRRLAALETLPQDGPFNDLADAAFAVRPQLKAAFDEVRAALGLPVHVTGSGAAMFVIAPSDIACKALARKVTALTGVPAVAARTL